MSRKGLKKENKGKKKEESEVRSVLTVMVGEGNVCLSGTGIFFTDTEGCYWLRSLINFS